LFHIFRRLPRCVVLYLYFFLSRRAASLRRSLFLFFFVSPGCLAAPLFIFIFYCLAGLSRCVALYFYFFCRRTVSLRRSLFFYFLLSRRAVSFVYFISFFIFLVASNGGTAAVAACVGLAGWALAAIGGSALFEAFISCLPTAFSLGSSRLRLS
jgi:hypothetical protein